MSKPRQFVAKAGTIETTARVVTWNVWGLYGPWEEREGAIVTTLADARPDILVLAESWAKGEVARPSDRLHLHSRPMARRSRAPFAAALLGTGPSSGIYASDHYAVRADIRY